MTRAWSIGAAAALVVVVAAFALSRGDAGATVRVDLPSANGLRDGSPVRMGGARVGEIEDLRLGRDDTPQAVIRLDRGETLQQGVRAEVVTSNLLGSKYLQLYQGTPGARLPDDATIPELRVSVPTDLDQVLNALTPDVRARAQILINEAGIWMTGRKADFSRAMELLPQDLDAGTVLLDRVQGQNDSLRRLVASSSALVTRLVPERREFSGFVTAAADATEATAAHREQLTSTLHEAPGALRSLTGALQELDRTAAPLGPAARNLSASSEPLRTTLDALPAFESSARPTLRTLQRVAPNLTLLGKRTTPVLRRAQPALSSLADTVGRAAPVTSALDVSIDDTLGFIEGWARAIQTRDSVSHLFRGRASIGPESMRSLLSRMPGAQKKRRKGKDRPAGSTGTPVPSLPPVKVPAGDKLPAPIRKAVDDLVGSLTSALGTTTGNTTDGGPTSELLDYLLGN